MSDNNFKVKNGLTIGDSGTPTNLTADGSGGLLVDGSAIGGLPSQSGNNGKYLTTDGSSASWADLSVPIQKASFTLTDNNTYMVGDGGMAFSIPVHESGEYTVRLKQGSNTRTSKFIFNATSSGGDLTEFAVVETGSTIGVNFAGEYNGFLDASYLTLSVYNAGSTNVYVVATLVRL